MSKKVLLAILVLTIALLGNNIFAGVTYFTDSSKEFKIDLNDSVNLKAWKAALGINPDQATCETVTIDTDLTGICYRYDESAKKLQTVQAMAKTTVTQGNYVLKVKNRIISAASPDPNCQCIFVVNQAKISDDADINELTVGNLRDIFKPDTRPLLSRAELNALFVEFNGKIFYHASYRGNNLELAAKDHQAYFGLENTKSIEQIKKDIIEVNTERMNRADQNGVFSSGIFSVGLREIVFVDEKGKSSHRFITHNGWWESPFNFSMLFEDLNPATPAPTSTPEGTSEAEVETTVVPDENMTITVTKVGTEMIRIEFKNINDVNAVRLIGKSQAWPTRSFTVVENAVEFTRNPSYYWFQVIDFFGSIVDSYEVYGEGWTKKDDYTFAFDVRD